MIRLFMLPVLMLSIFVGETLLADDCPADWGPSYVTSQARQEDIARRKTLSDSALRWEVESLDQSNREICGTQLYPLIMSWFEQDRMENHESCECVRVSYAYSDAMAEFFSRK